MGQNESIDKEEKLDTGSRSQLVRFSSVESLKQTESQSSKKNKKLEFKCSRVSPVHGRSSQWGALNISKTLNPVFVSSKKFFSASVPGSRVLSWATSPISRRPSPPRSTTPTPTLGGLTSPKFVIDDATRSNDCPILEVQQLRAQVETLNRKTQQQDLEIERLTKQLKDAITIAGEETAKCKAAKEVIKSLTAQLKDMAGRLPVGAAWNIKTPVLGSNLASLDISHPSVERLTNQELDLSTSGSHLPSIDSNTFDHRMSSQSRRDNSQAATRNGNNKSKEGDARNETGWVEQDEPGVYITLTSLPGGAKDLKRVHFSRKRFSEKQAEKWWAENRARVYEQYNVCTMEKSSSVLGSDDLPH